MVAPMAEPRMDAANANDLVPPGDSGPVRIEEGRQRIAGQWQTGPITEKCPGPLPNEDDEVSVRVERRIEALRQQIRYWSLYRLFQRVSRDESLSIVEVEKINELARKAAGDMM